MGIIWSGVQVIPVFFVFTAGGSALHSGGSELYLFFSYLQLADRLCIQEVLDYTCFFRIYSWRIGSAFGRFWIIPVFFVFPAGGSALYTGGSELYLFFRIPC